MNIDAKRVDKIRKVVKPPRYGLWQCQEAAGIRYSCLYTLPNFHGFLSKREEMMLKVGFSRPSGRLRELVGSDCAG